MQRATISEELEPRISIPLLQLTVFQKGTLQKWTTLTSLIGDQLENVVAVGTLVRITWSPRLPFPFHVFRGRGQRVTKETHRAM